MNKNEPKETSILSHHLTKMPKQYLRSSNPNFLVQISFFPGRESPPSIVGLALKGGKKGKKSEVIKSIHSSRTHTPVVWLAASRYNNGGCFDFRAPLQLTAAAAAAAAVLSPDQILGSPSPSIHPSGEARWQTVGLHWLSVSFILTAANQSAKASTQQKQEVMLIQVNMPSLELTCLMSRSATRSPTSRGEGTI